MDDPVNGSERRLGRSAMRIHQAASRVPADIKVHVEELLIAGRAMDFVARVHGYHGTLSAEAIGMFAVQSGIPRSALVTMVLPALKRANVADFTMDSAGDVIAVQDFLGVTGQLIDQAHRTVMEMHPSRDQLAVLHSVEIGSFAPLTKRQHLDQMIKRGFSEEEAKRGLRLTLASTFNRRIASTELNDDVIFNPYVWETGHRDVAKFLASLPSSERDALLGIVEQAIATPGLALPGVTNTTPQLVTAARKVGLIQAATVKSTAGNGSQQTYIFAPAIEREDDKLVTTEALHRRKLFVAHILFGHQKATWEGGRILNPVVLTNALVRRGRVGPASNIASDYHLLESHGIVSVEPTSDGRAFLNLIDEEIVQGGLGWLSTSGAVSNGGEPSLQLLQSPNSFLNPEQVVGPDDPAANEVAEASLLALRKEIQSATRQDRPSRSR